MKTVRIIACIFLGIAILCIGGFGLSWIADAVSSTGYNGDGEIIFIFPIVFIGVPSLLISIFLFLMSKKMKQKQESSLNKPEV